MKAGGPARPLAPAAARRWAERATEAPTPGLRSAPGLPTSEGWLTDLETVMGPDAGVRTLVASWVAGGLSQDKLGAAVQQATDKKLVFERLRDASKGIYQQRVVINDYGNIPGVAKVPFTNNSLPKTGILASSFGVNDPRFDLPPEKAITFASSAELREVKPGEKLYRVANDPITDPRGKTGGYWTRTPPASLAEVIGGTAVMPEWNNFQRVYEFTAPPYIDSIKQEPKFYVWEGPAAAQPVSLDYGEKKDNGHCLPGGAPQVFVNKHLAWDKDFSTHIIDATASHKKW